RETVGEFLADEGYGVLVASDGAEALALLRAAPRAPSVIVLDLKMPNVDGWAFREEQARDPAIASIPVIVVTATPRAAVHGAVTVLRKPLRLPHLGQAIEGLLAASERRQR